MVIYLQGNDRWLEVIINAKVLEFIVILLLQIDWQAWINIFF